MDLSVASTLSLHQDQATRRLKRTRATTALPPDIFSEQDGNADDSSSIADCDDDAFIESIKNELASQWKNKHISKGSEVTSAARIVVPVGFLQPIAPELRPSPAEEQNEVIPPRRRRRLLLELGDSSDDDGYGNSSPPCRDCFTDYPKRKRSEKNTPALISAWKNTCIPLLTDDSSKDRSSCDLCPCCGDSMQLIESKRPKIAEISGHALKKERESIAANRVANGSTHNLGLTLKGIFGSNKERTRRNSGFGAKNNKNQESDERICKITELGENSDDENQESAERRTCERVEIIENTVKENPKFFERTSKRRGLGEIKSLTLYTDRYNLLEMKLKEAEQENMVLVSMIEVERRNAEQEKDGLRKELEDASNMIGELVQKIRMLEEMRLGIPF